MCKKLACLKYEHGSFLLTVTVVIVVFSPPLRTIIGETTESRSSLIVSFDRLLEPLPLSTVDATMFNRCWPRGPPKLVIWISIVASVDVASPCEEEATVLASGGATVLWPFCVAKLIAVMALSV